MFLLDVIEYEKLCNNIFPDSGKPVNPANLTVFCKSENVNSRKKQDFGRNFFFLIDKHNKCIHFIDFFFFFEKTKWLTGHNFGSLSSASFF